MKLAKMFMLHKVRSSKHLLRSPSEDDPAPKRISCLAPGCPSCPTCFRCKGCSVREQPAVTSMQSCGPMSHILTVSNTHPEPTEHKMAIWPLHLECPAVAMGVPAFLLAYLIVYLNTVLWHVRMCRFHTNLLTLCQCILQK